MPDKSFDDILDQLRTDSVHAPSHLTADVMSRLSARGDILSWFRESFWRPVYATALPLAFGFFVGFSGTQSDAEYGVDDLLLADSFEYSYEEYVDTFALPSQNRTSGSSND